MGREPKFGMQRLPRSMVFQKPGPEEVGSGIWLDRMQPGGRNGPNDEVLEDLPGGRVWTDSWMFGSEKDAFQMLVPDIRLPANQIWPLHWHDCWIAVVILEGSCLIGDFYMQEGDFLISAAELEYGPLVIGPHGCQMFEVFAQLHLSPGGYSPEYRDHPTLVGGNHVFKERSELNKRNDGRTSLPVDGVEGLIKGHLEPGKIWDLGDPGDPDRGMMGYTALGPGETIAPHSYGDWHGLFVLKGGVRLGDRELTTGEVIIVEPGARISGIEAGPGGAEIYEVARTAEGMERLS